MPLPPYVIDTDSNGNCPPGYIKCAKPSSSPSPTPSSTPQPTPEPTDSPSPTNTPSPFPNQKVTSIIIYFDEDNLDSDYNVIGTKHLIARLTRNDGKDFSTPVTVNLDPNSSIVNHNPQSGKDITVLGFLITEGSESHPWGYYHLQALDDNLAPTTDTNRAISLVMPNPVITNIVFYPLNQPSPSTPTPSPTPSSTPEPSPTTTPSPTNDHYVLYVLSSADFRDNSLGGSSGTQSFQYRITKDDEHQQWVINYTATFSNDIPETSVCTTENPTNCVTRIQPLYIMYAAIKPPDFDNLPDFDVLSNTVMPILIKQSSNLKPDDFYSDPDVTYHWQILNLKADDDCEIAILGATSERELGDGNYDLICSYTVTETDSHYIVNYSGTVTFSGGDYSGSWTFSSTQVTGDVYDKKQKLVAPPDVNILYYSKSELQNIAINDSSLLFGKDENGNTTNSFFDHTYAVKGTKAFVQSEIDNFDYPAENVTAIKIVSLDCSGKPSSGCCISCCDLATLVTSALQKKLNLSLTNV